MTSPRVVPLRVERALALLPDLEVLGPLRALLISLSRPEEEARWSSSGPYLTVGKRAVDPARLRAELPAAQAAIAEHMRALYGAYLDALELAHSGDGAAAVAALIRAGRLEETAERLSQAEAWYQVALTLSQPLTERRPEIEALNALGQVGLVLGRFADAARQFQRAFALAEAVFEPLAAIAACEGLGEATLAQGQWTGARAWNARGLRLAEASADPEPAARLERRLGALALSRGEFSVAGEHLRRARARLEDGVSPSEMARVLVDLGRLEGRLGRAAAAASAHAEALAWAGRPPRDQGVEVAVRLAIAELGIENGGWLDAERELRDAEQLAVVGNRSRDLVRIYTVLGKLRGCQMDETGFVFFEQAIEVCHLLQGAASLAAEAHLEYGVFRRRVGPPDEARAHLERARELFQVTGATFDRDRAEGELRQLSA